MTRTYYPDHLEPIREQIRTIDSPLPFAPGQVPSRDESPVNSVRDRMTEVLPGIFVFLVPGHTWGQQAILFIDNRGGTVVFTPDVMPTIHHAGAAYSLAYDVEPYTSMITRRWFLDEAAKNDWVLVLDHEPANPLQRVRPDGKGWYKLIPENAEG
jgi:glyoxylase-like metal-dependent hydrolase (beta-lactamase superfamily II)